MFKFGLWLYKAVLDRSIYHYSLTVSWKIEFSAQFSLHLIIICLLFIVFLEWIYPKSENNIFYLSNIWWKLLMSQNVLWQHCVTIWLLCTLTINKSCQHVIHFIATIHFYPVTFSQIIQRLKTFLFFFFFSEKDKSRQKNDKTLHNKEENCEKWVISNNL